MTPAVVAFLGAGLIAAAVAPAARGQAGSNIDFHNPAPIMINDRAATPGSSPATATPYPSTINVSGVGGGVSRTTVALWDVSHPRLSDLDVLLVAPNGQRVLLISDVPHANVTNANYIFYTAALPASCRGTPPGSPLIEASDCEGGDTDAFPFPAPGPPYGYSPGEFNGMNPNGTWRLYVVDDLTGFIGQIAGGWTLSFYVSPAPVMSGSFSNSTPITINDRAAMGPPAPATPYPSNITVAGVSGALSIGLTVTLRGVSHPRLDDVDVLLVTPGYSQILLSDAPGTNVGNATYVFRVGLAGSCAETPYPGDPTGFTNCDGADPDIFPPPAPPPGGGGVNPNGTWSLYVVDDSPGFAGQIARGWTVTVQTNIPLTQQPPPSRPSPPPPPPPPPPAPSPPTVDRTPPNTRITSGPARTTLLRRATFRFRSTESGSTFRCRLDRGLWRPCRSPKTYRSLGRGLHTFRVRARDWAGNLDPTPSVRRWLIARRPPRSAQTRPCEPGYSPCLPIVRDLDCDDIRAMNLAPVRVTGSDRYRLDGDNDGWGCE